MLFNSLPTNDAERRHEYLPAFAGFPQKIVVYYAPYTSVIDQAVFVSTDLEKYTSYEDAIKSNVQLNESSN